MSKDLIIFQLAPEAQNAGDLVEMALAGEPVTPDQLRDALMTMPGGLPEAVSAAGGIALNLEAQAEMLRAAGKRLIARLQILETLIETAEDWSLKQCEAAKITKISSRDGLFTAVIKRNPPKVRITDEKALPVDYIEEEIVSHVKKKEIAKALKEGKSIPGAELIPSNRIEFK